MSIDELYGDNDFGGRGAAGSGLWAGAFAEGTTQVSKRLPVVIPGIDPMRQHGPCRWEPRVDAAGAAVLPRRGDPCVIGFDDDQEPWVIAWWPYG